MLVSIIIPMFNSAEYIGRCLDSVLSQSFSEIEVICIDDCSRDDTVDIVADYAKNDDRIVIIQNSKNNGPSASRNVGLAQAKGDYVMFVDSDDYIEPDTISFLVSFVKKNDYPDFVRYNFNSKSKRYNNRLGILANKSFSMSESKKTIMDSFFFNKEKIPTFVHLLLIKRKIIDSIRFDERMHYLEDSCFYLDLFSAASKCAFIDKKFYNYVENKSSITRDIDNTPTKVSDMFRFCDKITKYNGIDEHDKKKAISGIINLMMSHLMILEKSNWRMYSELINQKQFRKELKDSSRYSGLVGIRLVKRLYIRILSSPFYRLSVFYIPIAGIRYREACFAVKEKK